MIRLLTIPEIVAALQLHPVTVRDMLRAGKLGKAIKFGRTWRLPEGELQAALRRFEVEPPVSHAARRAGLEASAEAKEALRPRRSGGAR